MKGCHVVVIGGGPAGTLCAAQFAKRGARVTVYERKYFQEQASVTLGWPIALSRMGTDPIEAAGLSSNFGATQECDLFPAHQVPSNVLRCCTCLLVLLYLGLYLDFNAQANCSACCSTRLAVYSVSQITKPCLHS
jgi:aspartate oxidase